MLHASVVVCGFVGLSSAIRTDFKSNEDTVLGVGMVLQKIRILLPEDLQTSTVFMQVMGGLESKSETTPADNLQSVLRATVSDIVNVTDKHVVDQTQANSDVESKFGEIPNLVNITVLKEANISQPCTTASTASQFQWDQTRVDFACSMDATAGVPSCNTQLQTFNQAVAKDKTSLEDALKDATADFQSKTAACAAANCECGQALQTQCGKAVEFNSFIDVLKNEQDARIPEWNSGSIIKCLLDGVVEGTGGLTEPDLTDCTRNLNYAGELDVVGWKRKLQQLLEVTDVCDSDEFNFKLSQCSR